MLWELAAHTDDNGNGATPGVALLATTAGVSPATVKRALDWGRANGWIARTARGARRLAQPDTYALAVPSEPRADPEPTSPAAAASAVVEAAPQADERSTATPVDVAAMSASQFKTAVLVPAYGLVSDAEMAALRETYWTKLGAEG